MIGSGPGHVVISSVEAQFRKVVPGLQAALIDGRSLPEFLELLARELGGFIPFDRISFWIWDERRQFYRILFQQGMLAGYPDSDIMTPIQTMENWLSTHKVPLHYHLRDGDQFAEDSIRRAAGVAEVLSVPFVRGDWLLGAVTLSSCTPDRYDDETISILSRIGVPATVAMESFILREMVALRDERDRVIGTCAAAVSKAQSPEAVFAATFEAGVQLLGQSMAVIVFTQDGSDLVVDRIEGGSKDTVRTAWEIFAPGRTRPGALLQRAIREGPLFLENAVDIDPFEQGGMSASRLRVRSLIAIPLRTGSAVTGALVGWRAAGASPFTNWTFSSRDFAAAQALGNVISLAVLNARLLLEMRVLREQGEAIERIGQELLRNGNASDTIAMVTGFARMMLKADYASVAMPKASGGFEWVGVLGNRTNNHLRVVFREGKGFLGRSMATGRTLVIPRMAETPDDEFPALKAEGIVTATGVPLRVRNEICGVLMIGFRSFREVLPRERSLAEALAAQASMALTNARLRQEASRAIANREEVLAVTAHDLRGPLTLLVDRVEGLNRRAMSYLPSGEQATLRSIMQEGRRINAIIDELLASSAVGQGRIPVNLQPMDLLPTARSVVDAVNGDGRAVPTRLAAPDGPVMVDGDRRRLEHVLANLLDNARRHSRGGTPVDMTVTTGAGVVTLTVRDEGDGIDPNRLEQIFEARDRAAVESSDEFRISLALCRQVIEDHGGTLWATSDGLGKGMTFHIEMPELDYEG